MATRDSSSLPAGRASRIGTYIVTNGTKVAGAYVILKEQSGLGRDLVLLTGLALALGAQTAEAILLALIDRFFGVGERSK